MAFDRYIYIFLISIFTCITINTKSYAKESGKGSVCTAYSFASNKTHTQGSSLLSKIMGSVEEGILVNSHVHHNAGPSPVRDRDNFPVAFVITSRWQVSTSAMYHFFPAVRGQIGSFIPIARLLIFPKHWFW